MNKNKEMWKKISCIRTQQKKKRITEEIGSKLI